MSDDLEVDCRLLNLYAKLPVFPEKCFNHENCGVIQFKDSEGRAADRKYKIVPCS